jgi:hypothetical protein
MSDFRVLVDFHSYRFSFSRRFFDSFVSRCPRGLVIGLANCVNAQPQGILKNPQNRARRFFAPLWPKLVLTMDSGVKDIFYWSIVVYTDDRHFGIQTGHG